MANSIVVGDLHTKLDALDWILTITKNNPQTERIIFLGDYVDDWNTPPEASYNLLSKLIELKKQFGSKIILLLGNHDFSEWFGGKFKCSGFNPVTHTIVKPLFDENEDLFQLAFSDGKYLYTHAGVTSSWVKDIQLIDDLCLPHNDNNPYKWADYLNWVFKERNNDFVAHKIFNTLNQVGGYRGGFESPSPIWTDYHELISNPMPHVNQVVGHTPVKTITKHVVRRGKEKDLLYFCDTHSTYTSGENYGDNSFLEIEI